MLTDHRSAPVARAVRSTLDLLQKVTLSPGAVGREDVEAVRAEGVSDEAIEDALMVCACFNLIDRVADALGFDLPEQEVHAAYEVQFLEEGNGNEV